jgi:glycine hydroxymethyltransferase
LKRVLFVCTGNTCRSPMAEALFRDLVKDRPDFEVASAGVGAMPGQPASPQTADLISELGLDLSGFASSPLTDELVRDATHIFALANHHAAVIEMDYPDAADKTYLVTEFTADDTIRGEDISDPIGMGRRAYEQTRDMLKKCLPSLLAYIDQTSPRAKSTEQD